MIVAKGSMTRDPSFRTAANDWILLEGTTHRFGVDELVGDLEVHPGDAVIVAGFLRPDGNETSIEEIISLSAQYVEGTVLDTGDADGATPNLIYIEVPARDYRGFSGGPAAKRMADGRLAVFGMTLRQGGIRKEISAHGETQVERSMVLGILRLPKY